MANPNGTPENLRPQPWKPGQSGNPSGQPKEAANVRVMTQRMWGLFYGSEEDQAQYEELKAKYPRIAAQIEARFKQANEDANTAAITRVDAENLGPMVTKIDVNELSDERLLKALETAKKK